MWLPDKIYKALPWIYVAIGLAFFAGVYYLDQRDFRSGFYFAIGMVCITCGLIVHYLRVNNVKADEPPPEGDTTTP